jgi:hypothetical protein
MTLRIANGAGFLGDQLDAPRLLVEGAQIDYLTLEYLAELTMSILARLREKDPATGYAEDFLEVLRSLTPSLSLREQLRVVTNAGGVNPPACAAAAAKVLVDAHLGETPIGVVTGDDLLPRLAAIQAAGCRLENFDTGEPLGSLAQPVVSANAYLGARPIADCLAAGARLVITGRVADASLTVGPAVHAFGWAWDDWDRLAAASVAGHVIECGAQATGGYYRHWESLDLANVGYPVAELDASGDCLITKPASSGGAVNRHTVASQLVYEIGDPRHYLTPDVDVDFTTVQIEETGPDRVAVRGATGRPAPDTLKVSLAYRAGFMASGQLLVYFMASGQLLVYGRDCVAKAQSCAEMILTRLRRSGIDLDRTNVECLGAGDGVPGLHAPPAELREVMLRVTASDPRREALERFAKEFAPLITSGPPGLAGYAAGRPQVRPMFAYWPTLIARDLVRPHFEVRPARQWLGSLESRH